VKCQSEKCNGLINERIQRNIFTPCGGEMIVHPCEECGLLHWRVNGTRLINSIFNSEVFLINGRAVCAGGEEVDLENEWRIRK